MRPVLERGLLRVKSAIGGGAAQEFYITKLGESDLPNIMALQEIIVRNLHRSDILEPFSVDFMREHLTKRGFIIGLFSGGGLVAFRNVFFPDRSDMVWNLGRDIELPNVALEKVANLQLVCVHPDYRGNGLALKLNRLSLILIRERGTYEHICATVSPHNLWNLNILLNSGFHIRNLKLKYDGKMRYIMYQRLSMPETFDTHGLVELKLKEVKLQKRLLRSGYCGVQLKPKDDDCKRLTPASAIQWRLLFARLAQQTGVYVVPRRAVQKSVQKKNMLSDAGNGKSKSKAEQI
jgi:ribosomal protein S18 acetylase RimI-like enzyme